MDETNLPPSSAYPPPPGVPPPLAVPPHLTRRSRRVNGWRIAAVVLAILLIFSLVSHFGFMVSSLFGGVSGAAAGGPRLEEVVIESNHSAHKIVVIPLDGIIYGGAVDAAGYGLVRYIEDQLKLAASDPRVKAVLLKINSPGGEVLASDEISQAIADFQKHSAKPVIATMGSVAASGGYYVAAPCRWIVAHELTITGSIGVMMSAFNYRGLMDKVGLRPVVFKSGKFKDMLSGSRDLENLTPEEQEMVKQERAMIQQLIDRTFRRFKTVVQTGRATAHRLNESNPDAKGRPLTEAWEEYTDGRVWSGAEAWELGFVDELGDTQTAMQRALRLANISDANLVRYQQPFDLSNLFRLFGQTEATRIQVDMGLDLPRLQSGLLYFLSPTFLP